MASSTVQEHIRLAKTLPPRLLKFFARYPPPALLQRAQPGNPPIASSQSISTPLNTSSSDPNADQTEVTIQSPGFPPTNPFQSQRHAVTGRWHDPKFSLRRQAELVKLARENGVEELLPFTVKGTQERLRRRAENGLRVKGTGEGQKVKGHYWERTMKTRLDTRRKAMEQMPLMIREWKERGHGRGWKKWPK